MVKKECLHRPIINTVCNVDVEVFNLSLSLCLYLSSSVSLCLRIPAFAFVSTIINHPKPPPQTLWDTFACVNPLPPPDKRTAAHIHVRPRYCEARTLPPLIICRTQTPHNGLFHISVFEASFQPCSRQPCRHTAVRHTHAHCFISSKDFSSPDVVLFLRVFQFFEHTLLSGVRNVFCHAQFFPLAQILRTTIRASKTA